MLTALASPVSYETLMTTHTSADVPNVVAQIRGRRYVSSLTDTVMFLLDPA